MLTDAQRDGVFARRAESLAAAAPRAEQDTFEALVFAIESERYAFPGSQVREVRPLGFLSRLPGTPALIRGLINVRGRIVPVIDLRPLLGLPSDEQQPHMSVVLVSAPGGDVGVLATDRPTVRLLRSTDLMQPPPGTLAGLDPSCSRGITPDLVVVLDAERLLADSRLVVQHDAHPTLA
jgi:purine-binding chemotaxis protein CheW